MSGIYSDKSTRSSVWYNSSVSVAGSMPLFLNENMAYTFSEHIVGLMFANAVFLLSVCSTLVLLDCNEIHQAIRLFGFKCSA